MRPSPRFSPFCAYVSKHGEDYINSRDRSCSIYKVFVRPVIIYCLFLYPYSTVHEYVYLKEDNVLCSWMLQICSYLMPPTDTIYIFCFLRTLKCSDCTDAAVWLWLYMIHLLKMYFERILKCLKKVVLTSSQSMCALWCLKRKPHFAYVKIQNTVVCRGDLFCLFYIGHKKSMIFCGTLDAHIKRGFACMKYFSHFKMCVFFGVKEAYAS
jgi:hypothetical protein